MQIEEATLEHIDDVYKIICELEKRPIDKEQFRTIYEDNLKDNNVYYLIALDDSKVIGFASLHIGKLLHHSSRVGEIQEIVVTRNYQGRGIGTALYISLKNIARKNNCSQLEVCCNLKRKKTHDFYLKQGMRQTHYKFVAKL